METQGTIHRKVFPTGLLMEEQRFTCPLSSETQPRTSSPRTIWLVFIPSFVTFRTLCLGNAIILQDPHKKWGYFSSRIINDNKSLWHWTERRQYSIYQTVLGDGCWVTGQGHTTSQGQDGIKPHRVPSRVCSHSHILCCHMWSYRARDHLENTPTFPTTDLWNWTRWGLLQQSQRLHLINLIWGRGVRYNVYSWCACGQCRDTAVKDF